MSFNQSGAEKNEPLPNRKLGRSASSGQSRNFSGGGGKGGGGSAAPPSSSFSSNRSFKKSNNAHGGQSRVSNVSLNSDSNNASAARTVQNGANLRPPLPASDAPVTGVTVKSTDVSSQKSTRSVPRPPSSHPATVSSDTTTPVTPLKEPGDKSTSFTLQFGSISPGFMNGMQIPARTSSAPPNLDEQKRDQLLHDSLRAVPMMPSSTAPKQQLPKKDAGDVDQSDTSNDHPMPKAKKDVQVLSAPPVTQPQKSSVHSLTGKPMQMQFQQPQVAIQFGGPNPQIQSQGMGAPPLPVPLPMPLPMGNPQVQQQVFVPNLQSHMVQTQGIIHPGQNLNFTSQMGSQLPAQLGNLGIGMAPHFSQHQAGNFGGPRKVKITHPDTHEELRLDKRTDSCMDSGSSGSRSHPNVPPQSQAISSFPPAHLINYYSNSYNASSLFFQAPSSLPLTSAQVTSGSQAPRFNYQVGQGPQTSLMNQSALNSLSVSNIRAPSPIIGEPSNLEHTRDVHNIFSSAPSAPVQVTVKPGAGSHGGRVADSSLSIDSPVIEKSESTNISKPHGEASSIDPQRNPDTTSRSSLQQSKPGLAPITTTLPVARQQSVAAFVSLSADTLAPNTLSTSPAPTEQSASVVTSCNEGIREIICRSDSIKDQQEKPGNKGQSHFQPQHQVGGRSTSSLCLPSESLEELEHTNFFNDRTETGEASTNPASSGTIGGVTETAGDPPLTTGIDRHDASDSKTDCVGEGSTCVAVEIIGGGGKMTDTLDTNHCNQQDDFPLHEEQLKPETAGTKEQTEGAKQDEIALGQTELNSTLELTITGNELGSLQATQKDRKEPAGCCTKDDGMADNSVMTTSIALDDINAELSSSDLSTSSHGYKISTSDTSSSMCDSMDRKEVLIGSGMLDLKLSNVSNSSLPEVTLEHERKGTDSISLGVVSLSTLGSKDKFMLEPNRAKSTIARGKKKRKEILQKADAAGTTSDLYMAYKGPEEKRETAVSLENSCSNNLEVADVDASREGVVSSEKSGQSKAEPDDWEDAADISTPNLEPSDGNEVMAKKYSRDFLLTFSEQCTDLPENFEIRSDIAEALMISNITVSLESHPSPGRVIDRQNVGSRPDWHGRGMGDDEKWSKPGPLASGRDPRLDIGYGGNFVGFRPGQGGNYGVIRNLGVQVPVQYAGGILSGPMQSLGSQGGMHRNSPDSDRWQRATGFQKGLIPSPHTPLQVMHKADRKYQVGKITDEEEAKQRQLKAILNKLTPQNFEKLFKQVKAVNIDSAVTLTGVISQIFDKALMEPTFCEMYANFCYHLSGELPDFSEDNEKITFKRVLLNKCQEEFERGAREQEEANRAEEGEVKESEGKREEKRTQARRRMLGNIRLIGELYKKKMLTERIMHECIKKLLGQNQNPDEEDIEALCKLMSTIGDMIDHPKAKEHMDAYFDMMEKLSNNMKLSSRVRFMLRDSIDLRKNKWRQRRKVEGPKKIDEVHRDAAQERHGQAGRMARGSGMSSSVRRGQPMDFGPRGSNMFISPNAQMGGFRGLPMQFRGHGTQEFRLEDRHLFENRTMSNPLTQRPIGDDSITLGPQGGLARGMSFRGQQSMASIPLAETPSLGDSRRPIGDDSITLGPQGGLARGMSFRGQQSMPSIPFAETPSPGDSRRMTAGLNGYSSVSQRTTFGSRQDLNQRYISDRFASPSVYDQSSIQERYTSHGNRDPRNADHSFGRSPPTSPSTRVQGSIFTQNISSEEVWQEKRLRDMSIAAIKEFYSAKDEKEVALCVKELNSPSFYPSMVSIWVTDSFERKDAERDHLAKLLINLTKSREVTLSTDQLIKGFESVLTELEDVVNDAPRAAEFLGRILAKLILENLIPFSRIAHLIYEGGEEQGRLVEIGLAANVVGSILEIINSDKGESALAEIRGSSDLQLEKFRPRNSNKSWRLDKFI
ncbi:eukaryotic translation initiation factor 4G-like isoform X2 [Cornus florida]|uniref:eukaryotic translation initiation factor 4G-like isoform X2 n=1 Tax=Cornus florida TaxID=4283 RepID=UPI0028A2197A|nr:eukaryotic translation initiation factor 4G-like isoform X2 [Cornus florida]